MAPPRSYIAGLALALRHVLLMKAGPGFTQGEVLPAATAGPWRRARLGLDIALVLACAALVLILATGGGVLALGSVSISATRPDKPLRVVCVLVVLRFLCSDAGGERVLLRLLNGLARSSRALRVGILVLFLAAASSWSSVMHAVRDLDKQARTWMPGPALRSDSDHQHLLPLVEWVARRSTNAPVAVAIEDINPRGHLASYYCYPRLLLMSPAQHRRGADLRMSAARKPDPAWTPSGQQPSTELVAAWAAKKGVPFVIARPAGAGLRPQDGEAREP